jgi:hypothetical protein
MLPATPNRPLLEATRDYDPAESWTARPPGPCMRLRPLIALLAAYALGLQLLLAGLVPMPVASAGNDVNLTVFCLDHADQAGAPDQPGTKHVHKTCCVLCGISFLFAPPASSRVIAHPRVAGRIIVPPAIIIGAPHRHATPRLSQGPPHAA